MGNGRGIVGAIMAFMLSSALSLNSSHAEPVKRRVPVLNHGKDHQIQQVPRLAQAEAVAESSRKTSGIIIGPPQDREEKPAERDPESDRQIELAFWSSIQDSSDPADFEAYLKTFPDGAFVLLAANRLAALTSGTGPVESVKHPDRASPPADPEELARMLQTALLHAGCSPGKPDGQWGPRSRRALEQFNRHAGTSFQLDAASAEALEVVRSRSEVCPPTTKRGQAAPAAQRRSAPAAQSRSEPKRKSWDCNPKWRLLNVHKHGFHPEHAC